MEPKEQLEKLVQETGKRAVVLMTYNKVEGFPQGIYGDGRVIVYSWDKHPGGNAKQVEETIVNQFYRDFNLRKDTELIEHVFVYSGMNAMEEAINAARMIGHDMKDYENGKKVTLVGCSCSAEEKRRIAHDSYSVGLIFSECGGDATMGEIAKQILAGRDPKTFGDYGK